MNRLWLCLLMTVSAFGLVCDRAAMACPNCKLALEQSPGQPEAYMISILFMMGMMAAVTGTVTFVLYRMHRFECRQLEEAGYGHVFANGVTGPTV